LLIELLYEAQGYELFISALRCKANARNNGERLKKDEFLLNTPGVTLSFVRVWPVVVLRGSGDITKQTTSHQEIRGGKFVRCSEHLFLNDQKLIDYLPQLWPSAIGKVYLEAITLPMWGRMVSLLLDSI
jgi:hypothetical protein